MKRSALGNAPDLKSDSFVDPEVTGVSVNASFDGEDIHQVEEVLAV